MHQFLNYSRVRVDSLDKLIEEIHFSNPKFPKELICKNRFYRYLMNYFNHDYQGETPFKAQTIVNETVYISETFLEDYRSYYSTSYESQSKFSHRIHFFSEDFDKKKFIKHGIEIHDDKIYDTIWKSYLGYITIRPISNAVFGTSMLRTYPEIALEKSNTIYRKFHSASVERFDVFGTEIRDFHTLAFQQQDSAIGKCATFSIWFALRKLSKLFKSPLLTPSQIVRNGGLSALQISSSLPSIGLELQQIIAVIESVGLRIENLSGLSEIKKNYTKELIYAYNSMGIPILLGLKTYKKRGRSEFLKKVKDGILAPNEFSFESNHGDFYSINEESHLVTIVGYRMDYDNQVLDDEDDYNVNVFGTINGRKIDRFYIHDEGHGPFCRADFEDEASLIEDSNNEFKIERYGDLFDKEASAPLMIRIGQYGKPGDKNYSYESVEVESMLIPLDKSIKLQYSNVLSRVIAYETLLIGCMQQELDSKEIDWDIRLKRGVDYKQELTKYLKSNSTYKNSLIHNIIGKVRLASYPRYVWIAELRLPHQQKRVADLVFDATSLPKSYSLIQMNIFDPMIMKNLESLLPNSDKILHKLSNPYGDGLTSTDIDFLKECVSIIREKF